MLLEELFVVEWSGCSSFVIYIDVIVLFLYYYYRHPLFFIAKRPFYISLFYQSSSSLPTMPFLTASSTLSMMALE